MPTPPIHLLCESCGYRLDGLDPLDVCPECGRPVERSLPVHRPGSAWQKRQTPLTWAATVFRVLWRPRGAWQPVKIEARAAAGLLAINLLMASGAAAASLLVGSPQAPKASVPYALSFWGVGFLLVAALTAVEYAGIQGFGRARSWRISPTVALVICAHASVGWLISGLGVAIGWQLTQRTLYLSTARTGPGAGAFTSFWDSWAPVALIGPFVTGMVVFSLLAGAGFHALRYANAPGATPE